MHVRNTSNRFACLELGILVRPIFANIILLACSLKNGLQFKTIYITCLLERWFNNSKPFPYLLACLKDGLIIQNHLLTCLLACLKNGLIIQNHLLTFQKWFKSKPFACFLNSLLASWKWFANPKPLKTSVKQFIIIIH